MGIYLLRTSAVTGTNPSPCAVTRMIPALPFTARTMTSAFPLNAFRVLEENEVISA